MERTKGVVLFIVLLNFIYLFILLLEMVNKIPFCCLVSVKLIADFSFLQLRIFQLKKYLFALQNMYLNKISKMADIHFFFEYCIIYWWKYIGDY